MIAVANNWRLERTIGAVAAIGAAFCVQNFGVRVALLTLALGAALDDGGVPAVYLGVLGFVDAVVVWKIAAFGGFVAAVAVVVVAGAQYLIRRRTLPIVDVLGIALSVMLPRTTWGWLVAAVVIVGAVIVTARGRGVSSVPLLPAAAVGAAVVTLLQL